MIDLGKPGGENRAVTDLKLDVPVVTVGTHVLDPRGPAQFRRTLAPRASASA